MIAQPGLAQGAGTVSEKATALDLLLNSAEFDVVVSDIDLSGVGSETDDLTNRDGYYFVQYARDRRAEVPIFFYSSKVQDDQLGNYADEERRIYVISKDWMSKSKAPKLAPEIVGKAKEYQELKLSNAKTNSARISEGIEFESPLRFAKSPQAATIRLTDGSLSDRGEDLLIVDDHRIQDLLSYVSESHGKEIGESNHITILKSPIGVWIKFLPNNGGCYAEIHNASTIRSFGGDQNEALSRLA